MKNQVTLYIAEHNITGKKYFGKTIRFFNQESLQKYYHGSGLYWLRHLKKHSDKIGGEPQMKRWHFNNCKERSQ